MTFYRVTVPFLSCRGSTFQRHKYVDSILVFFVCLCLVYFCLIVHLLDSYPFIPFLNSFVSLVIWSLYKLPIAVFVLSVGSFCLDFLVLALVFGCGFTISFFCCFLIFLVLIIFKRCWCFSLVRGIFYIHLLYEIVKFFISWCLLWSVLGY